MNPVVRIDFVAGRTMTEVRAIADAVERCVRDEFGTSPADRLQVLAKHLAGQAIVGDDHLGQPPRELFLVQVFGGSEVSPERVDRLTYRVVAELTPLGVTAGDVVVAVSPAVAARGQLGDASRRSAPGRTEAVGHA